MPKRTAPPAPPRLEARVLNDPRAIRALAHPARLAVLDALAGGVELTATQCAERAGISPSAMSYHLRALEKWGIVERVESSGDGRERPWRTYPGGWSINAMPDAATATATATVTGMLMNRLTQEMTDWFTNERTQPEEWRDLSGMSNGTYYLTPGEIAELQNKQLEFREAFRGRTRADSPEGARRVRVTQVVIPIEFDPEPDK